MAKKRTTVWALEDGDYSDYHVIGVFSSRANAEAVAKACGYGSIIAWTLDPAISELHAGQRQYRVLMLKDGTVERVWEDVHACCSYNLKGSTEIWRRASAPAYRHTNTPDVLQSTVWATDITHAIKIVNEKRTQMIALGKW